MTARRVGLAVLVAASVEGFSLGLSRAAFRLGLNGDIGSLGAVLASLILVTSVLWLGVRPSPGLVRTVGAFVVPFVAVFVAALSAAGLAALAYALPDSEAVLASACVLGVVVGSAMLWRGVARWRLVTVALVGALGLIMLLVPLPPLIIADPLAELAANIGRASAEGVGLVCAVAAGVWAAALYVPAVWGQAEQARPADFGKR